MVKVDYGKSLMIPEGVSMPITVYLVAYETGYSFPDRELFTFEGWRMINSGRWALRRWNDNNPALNTTFPSTLKSIVTWTFPEMGMKFVQMARV